MASGSQQAAGGLEALAQARFGTLSQAELELLRAAPKGEVAWCGPTAKDDDPANDPAKADEWGPEREIRADLIRWLCVNCDAASTVDPKGIQVHAARITGELDLSFVSVPFPLAFRRCRLADDANLISADLPALNLAGSQVRSVDADGIDLKGGVFLDNGFSSEGEVRLLGAQIGGDLDCTGGTFKNPGKNALSADHADVKGAVFLREGFRAEGEVRLLNAQIGGDLDCTRGTFRNPDKKALSASATNVRGNVFLREGFRAEGEVRLLNARIGGDLDCTGGTFNNLGEDAFAIDGASVKGSILLNLGFSARGAVRLLGARIEGDLSCGGGTVKNPGMNALSADRADVRGDVCLDSGFNADGTVRLMGVQVGASITFHNGSLGDVVAQNSAVRGNLLWQGVQATSLDLTNASVGFLADDEKSWPPKGNLFVDGFVYGHISGDSPRDAKTRLRWLELQDPFTPRPYRQLAKVLGESSDSRGARKVLFEMERRRRSVEDRSWSSRLWSWLLKWTIGYGFHPERAVWGLLLLAAMGWGLFRQGYSRGAMAPTDRDAYYFFHDHRQAPDYYPRFTASVYSLENSLPFVNLGQKDHWTPDPSPRGSTWLPGFLRWFSWGQVLLGWLLATLFVAGVTGLVRKE